MKPLFAFTALLLLAACSGVPSGTYAAVGTNGDVARQPDGQPQLTISLGDGTAVIRTPGGEDQMAEYKFVDGMVYVTEPGKAETMSLKVQDDLLVATGKLKGLSFKEL